MNFDELQKQWNNQSSDDVQINKESLHKTKSIISQVNKNIKYELIFWIFCMLFLIIVPYIESYKIVGTSAFFYYFILFQIFICSLTYYRKFYLFNKSTKENDSFKSKENVLKMYYDLKFAVETYRSSCYFLIPQSVAIFFIVFSYGKSEEYFYQLINFRETLTTNPTLIIGILVIGIIAIAFLIIFTEWMIKQYYGKYLKQLKDLLNEFDS